MFAPQLISTSGPLVLVKPRASATNRHTACCAHATSVATVQGSLVHLGTPVRAAVSLQATTGGMIVQLWQTPATTHVPAPRQLQPLCRTVFAAAARPVVVLARRPWLLGPSVPAAASQSRLLQPGGRGGTGAPEAHQVVATTPGLMDLSPELLQCIADWLPSFALRARLRELCPLAERLEWRRAEPRHLEEELSGIGLGDLGARAVASALLAPQNAALRELCLGANGLGDAGAEAMAAALLSPKVALRRLSLRDNCIGDKGAWALASALAGNATLEELDLWGNCISDYGKTAVLSAAKCEVFVEVGALLWPCRPPTSIDFKPKVRKVLFDWIAQVHIGVNLLESMQTAGDPQDMLFRTFSHMDTYLMQHGMHSVELQLLGVACTCVAAGLPRVDGAEDRELVHWLTFVTDGTCTAEEVQNFAKQVGEGLGHQRHKPTAYTFLRRYLRRTGWTEESFSLANYLVELTALDAAFLDFRPQAMAAAAAVLSRQYVSQGIEVPHTPRWKMMLLQSSHVDLQLELAPCAAAMSRLHATQATYADLFVNKKYQSARLHTVAQLRPHSPCDAAYFANYLSADITL